MRVQNSEHKYLEAQGVQVPPTPTVQPSYGTTAVQGTLHPPLKERGLLDTYILAIGLGFLGVHHFYLGRPGFGLAYLLTFGLFGVGYVADWFRVPCLVKEANARIVDPTKPEKRKLCDAYLLWFPCGLLGFHHFYLRRYVWGIVYLLTLGLFGIGWIVDGFRMKALVKRCNEREQERWPRKKAFCDAYVLTLLPFSGLLGIQHYYLDRIGIGVAYTLSLGFCGVGWLVDIFRMPFLVKERNKQMEEGYDGTVRLDDAYIFLFPLGFLGLHHFYLNRPMWGLLYLCTLGVFGIGWLIDFCRLPFLVREYNKNILNQRLIQSGVSGGQVNHGATVVTVTTGIPPQPPTGYPGQAPTNIQAPASIPAAQVPPYQPPHYPYPQPGMYPPQQLPVGYAGAGYPPYGSTGPDSMTTITSSEGDQPPSYSQATEESLDNSLNDHKSEASAPPLYKKE